MKLSLGPVLFYWDKEHLGRFYSDMAGLPLDVIYLGETVCAKRRALSLDQWLGLGRELQACSQAQIVLSSLTLIEAASELSSLRRLCDNGELLVGRVISPSRSRALLGGVSVPVVKASEVVTAWATIHGQSEQVRLGTPERQREVLDRFAGTDHAALLARHEQAFTKRRQAASELAALTGAARERA